MRNILLAALLVVVAGLAFVPASLRAQEEAPATPPKARVELLDAGAEPRLPLRYTFTAGQKEVVAVDITTAVTVMVMGMEQPTPPMPLMRTEMEILQEALTDSGDLKFKMTITKAEAVDDGTGNPMMIDMMNESMKTLVGATTTGTMNTRGVSSDVTFKLPEGADPMMAQQFDQMKSQIEQMGAMLPEEPVGVGATWKALVTTEANGLSIDTVVTYKLVEQMGDEAKLEMSLTASTTSTHIEIPNMGMQAKVSNFSMSGSGTLELDFGKLVAKQDMAAKMKMTMTMSMGDQEMPMDTDADIKTKMYPVAATPTETPPGK